MCGPHLTDSLSPSRPGRQERQDKRRRTYRHPKHVEESLDRPEEPNLKVARSMSYSAGPLSQLHLSEPPSRMSSSFVVEEHSSTLQSNPSRDWALAHYCAWSIRAPSPKARQTLRPYKRKDVRMATTSCYFLHNDIGLVEYTV